MKRENRGLVRVALCAYTSLEVVDRFSVCITNEGYQYLSPRRCHLLEEDALQPGPNCEAASPAEIVHKTTMSCYIHGGSTTRNSDKSRNLSEKKRRDQFNMLVNELGSMVSSNTKKMDKSTVLKSTISFLKNHNEIALRSRVHEIQEDWKPSFLSNEEFTHLILEALDGFIMVFSSNGRIYYASQSVTSLLGYLPSHLANTSIYEIAYQEDQTMLFNILARGDTQDQSDPSKESQVSFTCHIKTGRLDSQEKAIYELVKFVGYFRSGVDDDSNIADLIPNDQLDGISNNDTKLVFVGTGRLQTPQLIREMSVVDSVQSEFTSRHSLEWKFLFLDHRATPIIGYTPIEVLGTSGYDYYHVDDLGKVVTCHEALMQKGEGTSCHYRFLTKGQQWIWLQTRFYITYNQWNSKPEFVVCTHSVVDYAVVIKQDRKNPDELEKSNQDISVTESPSNDHQQRKVATSSQSGLASSPWSSRSSKTSRSVPATPRPRYQGGPGSDTTSLSAGSQSSRHSHYQPAPQHNPPTRTASRSGKVQPDNLVNQCLGFLEPPQYVAAIPVQPIISAGFPTDPETAEPAVVSSLQAQEILHPQNIVMTPAQNQMQDELQRKHEELQQLIVHQQEELRRVSEQLFFARYGIVSPLINVSMPYATPPSPQVIRCVSSTTSSINRPMFSPGVQGVSVLPVPLTLSVPVVSSELFTQPLAVSSVAAITPSTQFNANTRQTVPQSSNNSNFNVQQQQVQPQQHQQQQQLQPQEQQQQPQQQPQTQQTETAEATVTADATTTAAATAAFNW
ncbi:circadian locomoter output cycles protein kaput isoform X2 [Athalia rosae]|uniref:circadian locomoter output cycles protein kaput isoform X2 n=1 Tax=Athalia rosae TaxID=37344 RepID=UPI002033517C|nr:circadian locomoter output cycles protein kaput isoform X2 [Athalia rosae]